VDAPRLERDDPREHPRQDAAPPFVVGQSPDPDRVVVERARKDETRRAGIGRRKRRERR
jgi:hypothetical protein